MIHAVVNKVLVLLIGCLRHFSSLEQVPPVIQMSPGRLSEPAHLVASLVPGSSVVLLRHRNTSPSTRAYRIIRTSTSQLFSRLRLTCHRELQDLPQGTTFKIVLPSSSQILSHYSFPSIVVTGFVF
ncbi:hypothetical protein BD769DRAFT_1500575 [Suillus cothurnatus]|nr:hypothetical protein BD769DRAFT_1500575 [Suillus cothurnatus]